MQKLLMRRKGELESALVRARGADFANAKTDVVSIGTCVQATEVATQHHEAFTILGAWDSDPDHGVISYLSPMAQALIGHKPGEEVEFEMDGGGKKHYRIDGITAYKTVPTSASASVPSAAAPGTLPGGSMAAGQGT